MRTAGLAATMLLLACAAQAQRQLDFSISGAGVFSKSVSAVGAGASLSARDSGDIFGSVRYHFNHLNAVDVNIGYTTNTQDYSRPPDTFGVHTSIFEFSAAYVITPFQKEKLQPFLFAGGGGLRWSPGTQYIDSVASSFGATSETSPAFLYGGGIDYRLWRKLFLRLQYRGLVFRAPDFGVPDLFISAKGHMAEPSLGLGFKF